MASSSDAALRQQIAHSPAYSGLRGLMDAVFERRSLRSKHSRTNHEGVLTEKRAKSPPEGHDPEERSMQCGTNLEAAPSGMVITEQNREALEPDSSHKRMIESVDADAVGVNKIHSNEISLKERAIVSSRQHLFSETEISNKPVKKQEEVVGSARPTAKMQSVQAKTYLRRGFSLRNSSAGRYVKSTSSEVSGSLPQRGSVRTHSNTISALAQSDSVAPPDGKRLSVRRSSFRIPFGTMGHSKENELSDLVQQRTNSIPGKENCIQKLTSCGRTSTISIRDVIVNNKQAQLQNADASKITSSSTGVHLEALERNSHCHNNLQHAVRASIRCSRQTQRHQSQTKRTVETNGSAFERGTVQLRDSRRRTAEIMRQRHSQPAIMDEMNEYDLTSSSAHEATKVKFLNETKPIVMNKWIRVARTTSAYANIAFEKSSNLAKHETGRNKSSHCDLDKNGFRAARNHDELLGRRENNSRRQDVMNGCKHRNRKTEHSRGGAFTSIEKNIQIEEFPLKNVSSKWSLPSKTFNDSYGTKGELLKNIPYVDNEPNKENYVREKPIWPTDQTTIGLLSTKDVPDTDRRPHSNTLQEVGNLRFENVGINKPAWPISNAAISFTNENATSKDEIQNRMENRSPMPKTDRTSANNIVPSGCCRISSASRLMHPSEESKRSRAWFVPLSEKEQVTEDFLRDFPAARKQNNGAATCSRSSAGENGSGLGRLAWPDEAVRSVSRNVFKNGSGECVSAWVRPRGGEVRAKVAVEERISAQPRRQPPPTRTLTTNTQICAHPSDISRGSPGNQNQPRDEHNNKEKDWALETKEHGEDPTACGNSSDGSSAAPLAHTCNPTVTVQERVDEAECTPMANGEHAHTSGLCSDRASSDVERILHNPIYRRPFQQFLEQQFCAENINFYVAVEEYRAIPDCEMERRSKVARQIYERHFTANSIEPVNIDNSTSKSIRDAILAQQFSAQLYDVAQYQIFHLLKYDCWPRYLRAGGVAPTFDDASGEEHPGPSTQPTQPSQQHQSSDKKRKSLLWHGLKPRFSRRKKDSRSGGTLSGTHSYGSGGSPQTAETRSCGGVETRAHSPLERLASSDTPTATVSPVAMSPRDTDGAHLARRAFAGSPCSPQPCGSLDSEGDGELADVFTRTTGTSDPARMSWTGSKRRQGFTSCGKQFSMPAELSYGQQRSGGSTAAHSTTTASPNRSRQLAAEVCTRFCTLMHNEIASSEQIPLNDPTESVGKWTSVMAARRGMDPRATEAVDAQSLSTIDPARQAMDALNNRCVCLMPVLHFALEILAPNASTKTGSPSNSRIVLLRARHGLSSGVVLRSVLAKFSIDYDSCVIVLSGTLEVIASHISVGTIGSRCVMAMTQQQFQERQHSPKRETVKDFPVSTHLLSPDANVPFYQHGDVAFFELPPDFDPRTGKISAARSFSNAKTEHTSGLLKFVRKASQAVTSREPETVASSSSAHHTHHHSGHNQHSSSMTSTYADKIRRKSVGTFQRTSSAAAAGDIPYCGENNVPDEQYAKEAEKRPEAGGHSPEPPTGSGSGIQTPADGRGRVYELPDFLRKENCLDSSSVDTGMSKLRYCADSVTASGANGSASRIPPIYASAVPSEKDLTPCEVEKTIVWQRADYV